MNNGPKKKTRALVLAALACATTSLACSAPAPEPQGATSAKLLAPQAMFQVNATLATRQALGISEWRIFRGQHDFVLTGYDAHGKPVKGVSLGFLPGASGAKASLRGRFLDGSYFASRHDYGGGAHANGAMSPKTQAFAQHAISDMKAIGNHFHFGPFDPSKGKTTTPPAPTTPTLPTTTPPIDPTTGLPMDPGAMACGGDLTGAVMAALQCLMSGGAGTTGAADPNAILACVMAAQGAQGAGGTCADQGTIQPPYDPTQDPTGGAGGAGGAGDPTGGAGGYPGDPTGGAGGAGGAGDPYGTGADPYGTMGDPQAGGMIDQGLGGGCPSCPGGAGDIYGDPGNGDVGLGDPNVQMAGDFGDGF